MAEDAPNDVPCPFQVGQRVEFHKRGGNHFGVVHWTGRQNGARTFPYTVVGIKSDNEINKRNFINSIYGMEDCMNSTPVGRALFLPEALVNEVHTQGQSSSFPQEIICTLAETANENLRERMGALELVESGEDDHAVIKALLSTVKECSDIIRHCSTNHQSAVTKLQNVIRYLEDLKRTIDYSRQKVITESTKFSEQEKKYTTKIQELNATIQSNDSRLQQLLQLIEDQETTINSSQKEFQVQIKELGDVIDSKDDEIQKKTEEIAELHMIIDANKYDDSLIQKLSSTVESWNVSRVIVQSLSKKQIGSGAWGVVYSAKFRGADVAIKHAHREILHMSTVAMLKREVMIMAHIQHPNLVRFIAAVIDDEVKRNTDTPIIISELMDMNLRAAYTEVDLANNLVSIFCDVAYALHYLHEHRQSIIHRDVSAPNVLLKSLPNGAYQAKVSDFGSANLVKQAQTAGAGAIVYCAPEMFPNEDITIPPQKQTTKVDVYSYGILLLEVIAKEMPTLEIRHTMLQKVKKHWNAMYKLIMQCTKPSPSERPTMADILNNLN